MTAIAAAEKKKKRDEMYYRFNTNRGMGYLKNRLRKYQDAVELFTNAIDNAEPGFETPLIIARSKAFSKRVDHNAARIDAINVLENNPDEIRCLENDAYTLYEKNDFEDSLVQNYCGLRRRKKPDNFYRGILVGKETIEDCIGRNAGPFLDNDRLGQVIVDMHLQRGGTHFDDDKDELAVAQSKYEKEHTDKMFAQKYLGRLAADKQFLLEMLKSPQLKAGNKQHNRQLQNILMDTVNVINSQQDTLMTQRPMYMLDYHKPTFSTKYTQQKKEDVEKSKYGVMKTMNKLFDEGNSLQRERKLADCMNVCDRLRRFIECQPNNLLPKSQREEVLNRLYSLIGLAYMDTKTLVPDWSFDDNDLRIEFVLNSKINNPRFVDRVRETYFPKIWNVKEMKRDLRARLEVSIHKMERMYLYHELSRCLFEELKQEKAYKMAASALKLAKETKSGLWQFNAGFLTSLSVLMEGDTDEAKTSFTDVMINARRMERDDCAYFVQKVIKIATEPNRLNYDSPNITQQREKEIMDIMSTPELRAETYRMLQRIKTAPTHARLKLQTALTTKTLGMGSSRRSMKIAARAKRRTLHEVRTSERKSSVNWHKSISLDLSKIE